MTTVDYDIGFRAQWDNIVAHQHSLRKTVYTYLHAIKGSEDKLSKVYKQGRVKPVLMRTPPSLANAMITNTKNQILPPATHHIHSLIKVRRLKTVAEEDKDFIDMYQILVVIRDENEVEQMGDLIKVTDYYDIDSLGKRQGINTLSSVFRDWKHTCCIPCLEPSTSIDTSYLIIGVYYSLRYDTLVVLTVNPSSDCYFYLVIVPRTNLQTKRRVIQPWERVQEYHDAREAAEQAGYDRWREDVEYQEKWQKAAWQYMSKKCKILTSVSNK